MAIQCSACKSESVQKVSLVYENGLSSIDGKSTTTGLGLAGGGLGVGVARSKIKGTQQTELSKKASPPVKKRFVKNLVLYIIGLFFVPALISGMLGFDKDFLLYLLVLAYIGVAILHLLSNFKYNKSIWPPLYLTWDRQYMCMTCGAAFVPGNVG